MPDTGGREPADVPERQGGAILLVVLSLLVLAALSHGALVLALGEGAAVALGRERASLRLAAEGVRDAWLEAPHPFPSPGGFHRVWSTTPEGRTLEVRSSGVGPGVALVEVAPVDGPGAGRPLARGIARWLDASGLAAGARVPALGLHELLPATGVGVDPAPCSVPTPPVGGWVPPRGALPSLGPWPVEELARMAEGAGMASAWAPGGDGEDAAVAGLHGGRGAFALRDRAVRGILAVEGELVLGKGAAIAGVVLVSGGVRMESGAEVAGMIRAGGGIRVEQGALLTGAPCTVREVLEALAPLLEGRPIEGGFPGSG